jgi:hypothetical protein
MSTHAAASGAGTGIDRDPRGVITAARGADEQK